MYCDVVLKLLFILPLQECVEGKQAYLTDMIGDVKYKDQYMSLFLRGNFLG